MIRRAKAAEPNLDAAKAHVDSARRQLDDFKGTSIERSKRYEDLDAEITRLSAGLKAAAEERRVAQQQAERAADEERQASEKRAADAALSVRGTAPETSLWDGSVAAVEEYLKQGMSNPDSLEHIQTSAVVGEGDYWVVTSSFRTRDSFRGPPPSRGSSSSSAAAW